MFLSTIRSHMCLDRFTRQQSLCGIGYDIFCLWRICIFKHIHRICATNQTICLSMAQHLGATPQTAIVLGTCATAKPSYLSPVSLRPGCDLKLHTNYSLQSPYHSASSLRHLSYTRLLCSGTLPAELRCPKDQ